jgi:hypothetical protein
MGAAQSSATRASFEVVNSVKVDPLYLMGAWEPTSGEAAAYDRLAAAVDCSVADLQTSLGLTLSAAGAVCRLCERLSAALPGSMHSRAVLRAAAIAQQCGTVSALSFARSCLVPNLLPRSTSLASPRLLKEASMQGPAQPVVLFPYDIPRLFPRSWLQAFLGLFLAAAPEAERGGGGQLVVRTAELEASLERLFAGINVSRILNHLLLSEQAQGGEGHPELEQGEQHVSAVQFVELCNAVCLFHKGFSLPAGELPKLLRCGPRELGLIESRLSGGEEDGVAGALGGGALVGGGSSFMLVSSSAGSPASAAALQPNTISIDGGPRFLPATELDTAFYRALFDDLVSEENSSKVYPETFAWWFHYQLGLPWLVMSQAWNLCDVDGDGMLDVTEFFMAAHLLLAIFMRSSSLGVVPELPEHLPRSFIAPAKAQVALMRELTIRRVSNVFISCALLPPFSSLVFFLFCSLTTHFSRTPTCRSLERVQRDPNQGGKTGAT